MNHPFQDSKLSVPQNPKGIIPFTDQTPWMILRLSARHCTMFPDVWPRLDKIPTCPEVVKQASLRALIKLPDGSF